MDHVRRGIGQAIESFAPGIREYVRSRMRHDARIRRLQEKARMRRRTSAIPTHTDDEIEAAALDAAEEIAQRLAAGEPLRRWQETLPDGTTWPYDDETVLAAAREYRERGRLCATD